MICVECGRPVNDVYKQFGGKGNIRLTRCDYCHKLADKYVEHENIIIFIDLLLLRPQVYRHLLFNRTKYLETGISSTYFKVLTIFIFFETYIRWMDLKEGGVFREDPSWYMAIIFTVSVELIVYIIGISLAVRLHFGGIQYAIVKYNYLIMAIIMSNFAKPFLLLTMIWNYGFNFNQLANAFILASNAVAVKVFLHTSTLNSFGIIGAGFIIKSLFQWGVSCHFLGVCY